MDLLSGEADWQRELDGSVPLDGVVWCRSCLIELWQLLPLVVSFILPNHHIYRGSGSHPTSFTHGPGSKILTRKMASLLVFQEVIEKGRWVLYSLEDGSFRRPISTTAISGPNLGVFRHEANSMKARC